MENRVKNVTMVVHILNVNIIHSYAFSTSQMVDILRLKGNYSVASVFHNSPTCKL